MKPINPTDSIVILTGAGISAESGLATFRSGDGLWANYKIEDVCTPQALIRNPDLVHEFYNMRRRELQNPEIQPNAAHVALAKLQQEWPGDVFLVTQNVDNLHERGGSPKVIHMHGELTSLFCRNKKCAVKIKTESDSTKDMICPSCEQTGTLRPDIVFFEEMPYHIDTIYQALGKSKLFLSIGTSGNVYPAAAFVDIARGSGAVTVEINLEPSANKALFNEGCYGPATVEVPQFVDRLLTLKL